MKRAKLLLQQFPQYATDFVFFMDEKVFSVTSPGSRQNKVSGRLQELLKTRMWANAQPDGRPAEHRWRPLFNAAKFG